jgi:hypothetical protein
MDFLPLLFNAAVTIVTTLYGFRSVSRQVTQALQTKVDLPVYQKKVTELHDLLNAEREKNAALGAEVRMLRELAHAHAA